MKMQTDECQEAIRVGIKAAVDLAKIAEAEAITEALYQYTGYLSTLHLLDEEGALVLTVYDWQLLEEL